MLQHKDFLDTFSTKVGYWSEQDTDKITYFLKKIF